MIDEATTLTREEYWSLDETERMKARLLAMRRAADASADAMSRRGQGAGDPQRDRPDATGGGDDGYSFPPASGQAQPESGLREAGSSWPSESPGRDTGDGPRERKR